MVHSPYQGKKGIQRKMMQSPAKSRQMLETDSYLGWSAKGIPAVNRDGEKN